MVDPADGSWWIADQPCDEDAISGFSSLLSVDGTVYLWERDNGWYEDQAQHGLGDSLTEVVLGP